MTDFEPMDWNGTRGSDPGRPPGIAASTSPFRASRLGTAGSPGDARANPVGAAKRSGLAPLDACSTWNFGAVAQDLDKKNRRLGSTHARPSQRPDPGRLRERRRRRLHEPGQGPVRPVQVQVVRRPRSSRRTARSSRRRSSKRIKLKKKGRPTAGNLVAADLLQRHAQPRLEHGRSPRPRPRRPPPARRSALKPRAAERSSTSPPTTRCGCSTSSRRSRRCARRRPSYRVITSFERWFATASAASSHSAVSPVISSGFSFPSATSSRIGSITGRSERGRCRR